MASYVTRQTEAFGTHNLVEVWQTYGHDASTLADVEYSDGICTVTVYDPTTSRCRTYTDRPTVNALAIVERHLASQGYKKLVEFHHLDGTVEVW